MAFVAAAFVATATVAHADPLSLTETAPPPAPEPSTYVSAGVMAGGLGHHLTAAYTAQGGYKLPGSRLWVHAMVVQGGASEFLVSGSGTFTQARAGVETKSCVLDGIVCSLFGVDAGYQHVAFTGTEVSFGEGDGDRAMVSSDDTGLVVVPRYTLDIGNTRVRFRPGIEIPLSSEGAGLELTAALAVKF